MKKRLVAMLLILAAFVCLLPMEAGAETYWSAQEAYSAALKSGDSQAILDAVERICAVYPNPSNSDEYLRVMFPVQKAAQIYESLGQFDLAAENYEYFLECVKYMCANGTDYSDYIKTVEMLIKHNSVEPMVYAETADVSNTLYYGAKGETKTGVAHGMCSYYDTASDNAYLLYVQFFNESIESLSWQLPKDNSDFTLVIGWNLPNENLEDLTRVANGEVDSYIRKNLEFVSTLNCKVLIRFGAEINCWSSLPSTKADYEAKGQTYIETFKKAFRRVATMADTYAPNAGMVYSPNDTSNWYFSHEDFYPGDEYVDWVGMSAYCNKTAGTYSISNGNDAFYCRGDYYENEILKIESIVETYGDRKPIVITEGGFAYNSASGVQTQAHAEEAMRYFYTYVSRVYPQIKCVMYFNSTSSKNDYMLYSDTGTVKNQSLATLYRSLNSANVGMAYSMGNGTKCGYTDILNIDEVTDSLNLSVYASYPTTESIKVSYSIDGKEAYSTKTYPYSYNINTSSLGEGGHLLKVTTTCMKTTDVQYFKVNVTSAGKVTVTEAVPSAITDVPDSFWGYESVAYGMATGLFEGKSATTFKPNESMNRAMFVTVLGRIHGVDTSKYTAADFNDVEKGKWYTAYVAWAAENGIVTGVSETEFAPTDLITREQMCAILTRYCDKFGIKIAQYDQSTEKFADHSAIKSYAVSSVYRAKDAGLVTGKGNNKFEPAKSATRAECATIFMRLCSNFLD